MRRDHFHTDDGVPIRWLPNPGHPKPFTAGRIDEFAAWLETRDLGSRNEAASTIRHPTVTYR